MEVMHFKRFPSLQYLSSVEIGITLLSNPDMVYQAFKRTSFGPRGIKVTYSVLDKKITALSLPRKLCRNIKIITMNMIDELKLWKVANHRVFRPSEMCTAYLCWTPLGKLDKLKTAQKLVNGLSDIVSRYQLASNYCLFYEFCSIWEAMSDQERNRLQNYTLIDSWIRDFSTEIRSKDSFIRWIGLRNYSSNQWELRFILDALAAEDRLPILRTAALNVFIDRNFRLHCFQQLDEATRQKVLQCKEPFVISPFQNDFLDLAKRCRSEENFRSIIHMILEEMATSLWQNFELVEILQQLWRGIPYDCKKYVHDSFGSKLLNILVNCNCLESLNTDEVDAAYRNSIRFRSSIYFGV